MMFTSEMRDSQMDGVTSIWSTVCSNVNKAGTKVGPDQLGPPVRVGSTRINSDRLGSSRIMKKNIKLNEILKLLPI